MKKLVPEVKAYIISTQILSRLLGRRGWKIRVNVVLTIVPNRLPPDPS
jgi:hypothetical protein